MKILALASASLMALAVPAFAQTATSGQTTSKTETAPTSLPAPGEAPIVSTPGEATTSNTTVASTQTKTPGQILFDDGVSVALNYTGEFAANPSGGIKQGSAYAGQLYFGADFDMMKLLGLDGTFFHIAFTQRHGDNLANLYIGNNTSVQQIWGTQNFHLAIATVEQKLFDGRLDLQAGRTTANVNFLDSPIYCYFQTNSACGNPTYIFKNSNFTYFPASTWGADAKFLFTPKTYVHVGAYQVNPVDMSPDNNGFYLGFDRTTGVIIPYEFGYATDFTNDELPRHYQFGGWYDTSAYGDPLNDASGTPAIVSGQPYAHRHERSGLFFRFDQQVTRPDPKSERGLTIFGVAMTNTSGQVQENQFYEIGALQTGTFPGRDTDNIGFVINDQEFSNNFIDNITYARNSVGGGDSVPHREFMMELEYTWRPAAYVQIAPNFQYIINPDAAAEPYRTTNTKNAFVVGVNFYIDAAKLLNFGPPS